MLSKIRKYILLYKKREHFSVHAFLFYVYTAYT